MPTPVLDCGCPCQAAYVLRKGTHEPLLVCGHHGAHIKAEAIRQGFIVVALKVHA